MSPFTPDQAADIARGFNLAEMPPAFIDDPYPFYAALRVHEPVHEMSPGQWLITRHADIEAMYRNASASSDKKREFGPKFGIGTPLYEHHTTSQVFNDAPLHTRLRRLLMGALNQRAITRMEPGLVALVDDLLDRLADEPAPCLIEHYAAKIPVEVIGNLLDVPRDERGPLRAWSLAILSALEPAPASELLARGNTAVAEFLLYLRGLLAHRRAHPGDPQADVLTRLIEGEVGGESLTEHELMHNCIFLLNAGHETTTNLLGNGVHAMITHPDQRQRLLDNPALINPAVEELLRFESPIQLNNRLLTQTCEVSGHRLPEGSFITLPIGAANRDPSVFADPDQLDIARKPNPHLAFGQGAHACSGMNVARLEGRIAIGAMLKRYPRLALASPAIRDRRVRFRGFRSVPLALKC